MLISSNRIVYQIISAIGSVYYPVVSETIHCNTHAFISDICLESANLDFLGHPPIHILAGTYYTQVPLRYGDSVAKVCVAPASEKLEALKDGHHDIHSNFSALRDAVVDFFRENAAEVELRTQFCTDVEMMPVEDASILRGRRKTIHLASAPELTGSVIRTAYPPLKREGPASPAGHSAKEARPRASLPQPASEC